MADSSRARRLPDDFGPVERGPPNRLPPQSSAPASAAWLQTPEWEHRGLTPCSTAGQRSRVLMVGHQGVLHRPRLADATRDRAAMAARRSFDDLPAPPFSDTTTSSTQRDPSSEGQYLESANEAAFAQAHTATTGHAVRRGTHAGHGADG